MKGVLVRGFTVLLLAGCVSVGTEPLAGRPSHHVDGGFRNPDAGPERPDGRTRARFWLSRMWASTIAARAFEAPRVTPNAAILSQDDAPRVTWIGHSTLLVQLDGVNVLADPHWSTRAGPLPWLGPKRLSAPGVAWDAFPRIHAVVISHDHYDHLDFETVTHLARVHDPVFVVPLGLKQWFERHGMTNVHQLDWWESYEHGGVTFMCLPSHHRSQRTPRDADRRLWASWAITSPTRRFYFAGDTAYFGGFREIGERVGPFDLTALPIGAYRPNEIMRASHTTPEEAVQAFEDLRGRVLLGIHWGTFDLSEEPLAEPPERMLAEAKRAGIPADRAWILKLGETRRW
jgi:N-acyl-phosphatidylethanolamine-hydrolysing phospholipase D